MNDEKVQRHLTLCLGLNELYARKNADYGDSFHQSFVEEGMAMARIRLGDKFNRFKTLSRGGEQMVHDESIKDTLLDLANYAVMTVLEIECMEEQEPIAPEGKWKLNRNGSGTCSNCHKTSPCVWDFENWLETCPNCGAIMKEIEKYENH